MDIADFPANSIKLMDARYAGIIKKAVKILIQHPKSAAAMMKVSAHESRAKKQRGKWQEAGVSVPPVLIVSATDNCNLACKECYSANVCREKTPELTKERIAGLLDEASAAGCSTVLLAGGEPLLARDWVYSVAEHKELLGLVFTNGQLFDGEWYGFFSANRNIVPLLSIEGSPERTDNRRGGGVTEKIKSVMAELRKRKIPFGISVTTGAHNIGEVTAGDFVDTYIELGCRLVIHVEYVPMGESDEFLPLSENDKQRLSAYCCANTNDENAIFIAFPGNEAQYGGCLAAGRGFAHIAASGVLEPCPFAPYSDRDLNSLSFIEALKSPLFAALRADASSLHEGAGGCSLRNKEAWIREIIG
ncbi:MAG: radical SAM protein [Defluviitaleaceae bacterium]|nr:radical SAM protein [Defluviitaleaceae bacterium]MCL2835330.1 radical SAM protein [Defluviitaleaceae bacterium]